METKNASPGPARILAVSDEPAELEVLQHQLRKDFGILMLARHHAEAMRLFGKYQPQLLILAHHEVSSANEFRGLVQDAFDHGGRFSQILLLCRGCESEQAYRLYEQGKIDDFVADRPLFDQYRLRLSIAQAFARLDHTSYARGTKRKFNQLFDEMKDLERLFSTSSGAEQDQQRKALRQMQTFTRELREKFHAMEERMRPAVASLSAEQEGVISNLLQDYQKDTLAPGGQQVIDSMQQGLELHAKGVAEFQRSTAEMRRAVSARPKARILLVDDDRFYRESLGIMLDSSELALAGCAGGREAVEYLGKNKVDLVLLDYQMPELDGIQTLKQIKAMPQHQSLPVIMLTGHHSRQIVRDSIASGATDFIVKPGNRLLLLSKIFETLGMNQD